MSLMGWECPKCGHYNTAYYKEVPEMLHCTNCAGCDYYCRKTLNTKHETQHNKQKTTIKDKSL